MYVQYIYILYIEYNRYIHTLIFLYKIENSQLFYTHVALIVHKHARYTIQNSFPTNGYKVSQVPFNAYELMKNVFNTNTLCFKNNNFRQ